MPVPYKEGKPLALPDHAFDDGFAIVSMLARPDEGGTYHFEVHPDTTSVEVVGAFTVPPIRIPGRKAHYIGAAYAWLDSQCERIGLTILAYYDDTADVQAIAETPLGDMVACSALIKRND